MFFAKKAIVEGPGGRFGFSLGMRSLREMMRVTVRIMRIQAAIVVVMPSFCLFWDSVWGV